MNVLLHVSALALIAASLLVIGGRRTRYACIRFAAAALVGGIPLGAAGFWQGGALVVGGSVVLGSTLASRGAGETRRILRTAGRALWVAGTLSVSSALAAVALLFPVFTLPTPSGPHAIGVRHFQPVDSTRPERLTADADDRRHVPLQVWYPTDTSEGPTEPYWPRPGQRVNDLAGEVGLPGLVFSHLDRISTHARLDAPTARAPEPLPVLLFSHGYAGAPDQSTFLMEDLASHGYVVFSVGHPYEALALETASGIAGLDAQTPEPSQQLVDTSLRLLAALEASDSSGRVDHADLLPEIAALPALEESFAVWVADGRFALDWIAAAAAEGGVFEGRFDGSRIGVFGHSFGGAMAAELCSRDDRCAAGINIDGAQMGTVMHTGVPKPFLFLYSEPSTWINHPVAERSDPAAAQATISEAAHLDFTDLPSMTPLLRLVSRVSPVRQVGPIAHADALRLSRALVREFFDHHLRRPAAPRPDIAAMSGITFEPGAAR